LISVDGVDFKVPEHGPEFSSHKFAKKSGLRYEVGLCILTGDIVWINGPYACGHWPDLSIARDGLNDAKNTLGVGAVCLTHFSIRRNKFQPVTKCHDFTTFGCESLF